VELPLRMLSNVKHPLKPTLMALAYLMHLAKTQEGSACGGETGAMVISKAGGWSFVSGNEMRDAEELAAEMDTESTRALKGMLGLSPENEDRLVTFATHYKELSDRANALDFPSLKQMDKLLWAKRCEKRKQAPAS
jgi:hypothetical protein